MTAPAATTSAPRTGALDEFAKSTARFVWALSVFGADQIAHAFSPRRADEPTVGVARGRAALAALTRATEDQLDEAIRSAFSAGDRVQSGVVDLMCRALTLEAFTPRYLTKLALDVMRRSAGAFDLLASGEESAPAGQEFRNKLQAFTLFEFVDELLPPGSHRSLPRMIERVASLEPFRSVWAMEGVGHYYTESIWARNEEPRRLLAGEDTRTLPERSLVPLHAGMGLSLANRALATVKPDRGDDGILQALRWFLALCRSNSREGYVGAAYEALGLIGRNLYPQMIDAIDRLWAETDDELSGYFWHGVGRALYFAPTNLLPWFRSDQRLVEAVAQEPPNAAAARNAVAGLAWAMTLVNIRQPQILEAFVRQFVRGRLDEDAFADGVSSAVVVWRHAAPDDPDLETFCRHQPAGSHAGVVALWNEVVSEPCAQALRAHVDLVGEGGLGDLFHHRPRPWTLR